MEMLVRGISLEMRRIWVKMRKMWEITVAI